MAASAVPRFTHEDFLDREQQSPFRHEYCQGRIEMMAGGTWIHALLSATIARLLGNALGDRDCSVQGSDFLIRMAASDMSSYPDAMVVCGKANFVDRRNLVIDNPVVVVEVLSPSTVEFDRGTKLAAYKQLESLREILLISQDQPSVEYLQNGPNGWTSTFVEGRDAELFLVHLQISIPMAELYRRVAWDEA